MQSILAFISGGTNQADSAVLLGAIFFTFMFMFFFVLAVTDVAQRRSDIRKRTAMDRVLTSGNIALEQEWETTGRSLRFQSYAENSALLAKVERGRKSQEWQSEKTRLQRDLVGAGYFGPNSALWFQGIRLAMLVGAPLAAHLLMGALNMSLQPTTKLGLLAAIGGVAFLLPGRYLVARRKAYQRECREGFPDFMDLMVVCSEAGLSPRAAIDRISREISYSYPFLGANLYFMSLELRAGATLAESVESLALRTGLEEVVNLGSLLYQTEQLGTSIGDALRIYSEEMRDKRLSRAEEKAHSLPVKLTLPLGLFIFPVMLVVIGLPVFIRIKNALF
ncbi:MULTISPECIES: type II secretion system F family protein [Rhodomicrobium]|uniref:type II secretion system F family protein n=1 Tax=Rhodomicrobium TaxID=1068 RepID=UPI000B4A7BE2|nr:MULTISPECIES: type II secretion system F family protein [Rhodomicrobium]